MAAAVLCLVDFTFFLCLDTTFGLAVEVAVLLLAPAAAGVLCGVWAAPAANIAPALNIVIMIKFFILSLLSFSLLGGCSLFFSHPTNSSCA